MLNKNSKYNRRRIWKPHHQLNQETRYRFRDPDVVYPKKYLNVLEWLQNPKIILDEFYTSFWQRIQNFQSHPGKKVYFQSQSTNSILNKSDVTERSPFVAHHGKDYYVNRGKDTCMVVLGGDWTSGNKMWVDHELQIDLKDNFDTLDFRLEQSYAGILAKKCNTDLYFASSNDNSNNTDNVFSLIAILDWLQEKNYREIFVVFDFQCAEQDWTYSVVWGDQTLTSRYGKFYKPNLKGAGDRTVSNMPDQSTPWAYYFWHLGAKRDDVLNNGWNYMEQWPYGFFKYEEYFKYYDLCILELLDAITDKWLNVSTTVMKTNHYWKEFEFGKLKIIEKPWMQTVLEHFGHNLELSPINDDKMLIEIQDLFIVNPLPIQKHQYSMLREERFLQDAVNKKQEVHKILNNIKDKDYFYEGYPQRECHHELAWYLIDKCKWKL